MRFIITACLWASFTAIANGSPIDAVASALSDLKNVQYADRPATRYLATSHIPAPDRKQTLIALFGHLNAGSLEPLITCPPVVLDDGSTRTWPRITDEEFARVVLVRVNLMAYRGNAAFSIWEPSRWDRLAEQDPHFHATADKFFPAGVTNGKPYAAGNYKIAIRTPTIDQRLLASLETAVGCKEHGAPILYVDNFIWQTAIQAERKVGYYGMLGIKNRNDFDKIIGLDRTLANSFTRSLLAVVSDSGVIQEPRRIERLDALGGGSWWTYDNFAGEGGGAANPIRILNGGFKHTAEEALGHGANGFLKAGLFNADGTLQDTAPDKLGGNRSSKSTNLRINVYLDCYHCHSKGGLQDFTCWARNLFTDSPIPLQGPDLALVAKLRQQYLRPYEGKLKADRAIHDAAVKEATGLDNAGFGEVLASTFARYDEPVSLERAAAEMGVTPDNFRNALKKLVAAQPTRTLDTAIAGFLLPAERRRPLPRATWHEEMVIAGAAIHGYSLPLKVQ